MKNRHLTIYVGDQEPRDKPAFLWIHSDPVTKYILFQINNGVDNWETITDSSMIAENMQHTLDILSEYIEDAQEAIEAAERLAQDMSTHAVPYIGDNGNWFTWNYQTSQYEDTGKQAKGDTGAQGTQGPQGEPGPAGPTGPQGNTGASVDYPYELVNNLTTDDATKGLSAAQGVVLKGEVSQLSQDVSELDGTINGGIGPDIDITPTVSAGYYYTVTGTPGVLGIVSAGTSKYSGTIVNTATPPTDGVDVSGYIGRTLKVVMSSKSTNSQRKTVIVSANNEPLVYANEMNYVADGDKYSYTFIVPAGAKWFYWSSSSVGVLDSVKILGEETQGLEDKVNALQASAVQKKLNVLLIGSSFGVNTMVQFPALAIAGGVDLIGGNLYTGGATLNDIVNIINGNGNFETGRIYTKESNSWQTVTNNITAMLALYDWDIIILQRAAPNKTGGSDSWTASMAQDLETIIQYIQANTSYNPKIMFNSVFGRSVGYFNGSRENEIASAELIMSTAKDMQEQFGLEVIPAAIAIQNARNTSLSYVPTFNSSAYTIPDLTGDGDHLDTGVGSYILGCLLFEQICGKRFDMSVLNLTALPTLANVTNNGAFTDSSFTQITEAQARIARYAAMLAVREPWVINTELGTLYPYPV